MIKKCIAVFALMACALPASAEDPQLICFGNEPSWGIEFAGPSSARLILPDQRPMYYRGSETRLDFLKEGLGAGKPQVAGAATSWLSCAKRPAATPCPTSSIP